MDSTSPTACSRPSRRPAIAGGSRRSSGSGAARSAASCATRAISRFTWLDDLIRDPRILDAVEDLLGPDLCWSSSFFIKEARDPAFVSWHQDSTYWGLSEPDVVTAWVALSESSIESGAMRMVPGTHTEQVAHRNTFAPDNLLSRGQEIMVEVDEARAVDVVLHPGEMSLHHVRMFHGSPPNRSADRRIGYAIRYIPTHVRQIAGAGDTATLVRGVDAYHHFLPEEPPAADLDPAARARHAAIMKGQGGSSTGAPPPSGSARPGSGLTFRHCRE